jgi:hypothetical protein
VLKGNFILEETGERPLDGDVFGQPAAGGYYGPGSTDLVLPSGDTIKGGDFESWFFIVPPAQALQVETTIPIDGALFQPPQIPPSYFMVTFNKDVQMASVTAASFGVYDDLGVQVPGQLDPYPFTPGMQVARIVTFTPASGAFPVTLGKLNTFKVILRGTDPSPILDNDGLPLNGGTGDFVSTFAIDAPDPARIISVDPADGATVAAAPAVITITLSKGVQMSSVTAQTFRLFLSPQLMGGGGGVPPIPGTIGPAAPIATTITFTPTDWTALNRSLPAVLTVQLIGTGSTPIIDVDGVPLQGGMDYMSTFTIEAAFTAGVSPMGSQATAPASIRASFTNPVGALPANAFGVLDHSGNTVAGGAVIDPADPRAAVWTPANPMADGIYTIVLSGTITDAIGQVLNNGHDLTFPLSIGLALMAAITVNQVPRPQIVMATFTDAVGAVTAATFTLTDPNAQAVPAAVTVAGVIATLTPAAALSPGIYTATLSGGILGAGGQPFNGGADLVAPVVIEPAFTVAGVTPSGVSALPPTNNVVVATFTDPPEPASVTVATFQVLNIDSVPIAPTSVTVTGATASLAVPPLAPGDYIIRLAGQIKDLAGQQLNGGIDFTIRLTVLRFTVVNFKPQGTMAAGPPQFDVAFSAPVNRASFSPLSFFIQTSSPGRWLWVGTVVLQSPTDGILVPAVQMPTGSYTVFLAGSITDAAGRQLNDGAGASFPIVIPSRFDVAVTPVGTIPAFGALGQLTATFSAPFDQATVNPPTVAFILRTKAGVVVPTRYVVRPPNQLVLTTDVALPLGEYVAEVSGKVVSLETRTPVNNGQNASFPIVVGKTVLG